MTDLIESELNNRHHFALITHPVFASPDAIGHINEVIQAAKEAFAQRYLDGCRRAGIDILQIDADDPESFYRIAIWTAPYAIKRIAPEKRGKAAIWAADKGRLYRLLHERICEATKPDVEKYGSAKMYLAIEAVAQQSPFRELLANSKDPEHYLGRQYRVIAHDLHAVDVWNEEQKKANNGRWRYLPPRFWNREDWIPPNGAACIRLMQKIAAKERAIGLPEPFLAAKSA